MRALLSTGLTLVTLVSLVAGSFERAHAKAPGDLAAADVLNSIDRGRRFLISRQDADGGWTAKNDGRHRVGVSALSLLALINCGMSVDDEEVRLGLRYLRSNREARQDSETYHLALMIMALAAAKDGNRDRALIADLAAKLEGGQLKAGANAGSWSYSIRNGGGGGGGDRSNGQYAILGLREAAYAGAPVNRRTWQRARDHWVDVDSQNSDGGWGYTNSDLGAPGRKSTGSMTSAGVATLVICDSMLRDGNDRNADGTMNCCADPHADQALKKAFAWMGKYSTPTSNAGSRAWVLYSMYGLERAGRLSGTRFFRENQDWYREGAKFLIAEQSGRWGSWQGVGSLESTPVVGTSLALLFLSKGLAPVLINKLKYGPARPGNPLDVISEDWNQNPDDARNLVNFISGLEKWPKLLNWQVVEMRKASKRGGVEALLQAPIVQITGRDAPEFDPEHRQLLKEYVEQGGVIFASACCTGDFDRGFRALVKDVFPDLPMKPLPPDHPVFRSEFLLDPATVDLWGVDFGCRTAVIYSPFDLTCRWDKWAPYDPPKRDQDTKLEIDKAMRIGVNIVAYVTGREPVNKIEQGELADQAGKQDAVTRGLLQVAKLRHAGGWDTAPQALRNLLMSLNRTVGTTASTKQKNLPATDPNLFRYPLLYMHGRTRFQMGRNEREQLRKYLDRGGVLFADACCGATQFDRSFRDVVAEMYPDKKLERIPVDHEIFTTEIGYDVKRVKLREPAVNKPGEVLNAGVRTVEPYLEGVQIDGRYAVIYSRYDISCALERQSSLACTGYLQEDAAKIAINVVLYAMLQDVAYAEIIREAAR